MDNFSRYRKNQKQKEDDENEGLLVFGYTCRIYPDSERANSIAEERHLQNWNGDSDIRIDRYDVRLLLTSFNENVSNETEICPTEEMEEQMCDEERYLDMYTDLKAKADKEEEEKKRKTEIGFDYGTSVVNGRPTDDNSDSEDEPFVPPPGIKLPVGLTLPENQKQNHLIEKTAVFVVAQGPQMEIVIKAKQRNNTEQFGFLDFDNTLNPYYKYISKLIREKKYTPEITKNKGVTDQDRPPTPEQRIKPTGALAAIAIDHGSDESDSDCELHPSLLSKNRSPSPDIMERTSIGPMRKPASPPPQPVSVIRSDYDMSKSNDSYASLFKSLSNIKAGKDEEKIKEEKRNQELKGLILATSGFPPDEEWRSWWATFYGYECPMKAPCPLIPPPPDLEPVVNNYACFVARHGATTEAALRTRADLQLNFMNPNNPHFSYYQHKVRFTQWEMNQMAGHISNPPVPVYNYPTLLDNAGTSEPSSPGPEASLNRKQRRRLQDASIVGVAPPPGVIDPILLRNNLEMNKSQSSPSLQWNSLETDSSEIGAQPYTPTGSISFSIQPIKEETKKPSIDLDDPLEAMVQDDFLPSTSTEPSLPLAPVILNNTQLDRKEKARIFMEKLMNEKRAKKLQEAESARIQELERKKLELEKELQREESTEEIKVYEATSDNDDEQRKATTQEPVRPSLHMIDELINKRIDNLLESNGLSYIATSSKIPAESDNDDRKRKEKKEKKKKSKHRYERRRSRSRSKERSKESKRRRRSSSSDRDSRRKIR
ncbi:unnamed protein product [Auanema sp. JU1783]|nr:unnamed protein product [Auanema sp. JU1783]